MIRARSYDEQFEYPACQFLVGSWVLVVYPFEEAVLAQVFELFDASTVMVHIYGSNQIQTVPTGALHMVLQRDLPALQQRARAQAAAPKARTSLVYPTRRELRARRAELAAAL